MSRQIESLLRSNSHPANLQNPIPIIPFFAFPSPDSAHINTSSGMKYDANSDIKIFQIISQFENSDLETIDKFADSEPSLFTFSHPSPSTFSKTPFQPVHSQTHCVSRSATSHVSQVTPTYSPFTTQRSTNNSPDNTQISDELNNFITLQHQIQYPHTLTIHQLSSTITSSNPPTPTPTSDYTPLLAQSFTSTQSSTSTSLAYRIFKRKFPNYPFPSKPGKAREHINHPTHTNTTKYFQVTLPFFTQYTFNHSDPNPEPHNFVDEHVIIPTLHWTSYYNFTNPLALPLLNINQDKERNKNEVFRLTTALTPRQFTHVGFKKITENIHRTPS